MNWVEKRTIRLKKKDDEENGDFGPPIPKEDALDFTELTWGKYRGKSPAVIAESDPSYVVWMYDNVKPTPCSLALRNDCEKDVRELRNEGDSQDDVMDTYDRFNQ
jgi:hypothetical protein